MIDLSTMSFIWLLTLHYFLLKTKNYYNPQVSNYSQLKPWFIKPSLTNYIEEF